MSVLTVPYLIFVSTISVYYIKRCDEIGLDVQDFDSCAVRHVGSNPTTVVQTVFIREVKLTLDLELATRIKMLSSNTRKSL